MIDWLEMLCDGAEGRRFECGFVSSMISLPPRVTRIYLFALLAVTALLNDKAVC